MFEGLLFCIENWDDVALIKNGELPNQYPRFKTNQKSNLLILTHPVTHIHIVKHRGFPKCFSECICGFFLKIIHR